MKKPSARTMLIGNPLMLLIVVGFGVFAIFRWTQESNLWPFAVGSLFLIGAVFKANDEVNEYTAWKRAWDAMGAAAPTRRASVWRPLAGAGIIVGGALYLAAHPEQPGYTLALGWLVFGGGLAALVGFVLWLRRRPKRSPKRPADMVVAISVTKPVLPVPTMKDSYSALPEHCWRVL